MCHDKNIFWYRFETRPLVGILCLFIVYFLLYHSSSLTGIGSESGAASPYTPSVVKTEKKTDAVIRGVMMIGNDRI